MEDIKKFQELNRISDICSVLNISCGGISIPDCWN